jgi:hypothetical protein
VLCGYDDCFLKVTVMAELDTPPSRGSPHRRNLHDLEGEAPSDGWSDSHAGEQGYDRPDQTVFDLSMDYSDEDVLLDWEQYTGMK